MFEIIVGIGVCVVMGKIAGQDGHSGWIWGLITFGLCAACIVIPLPFLRLGIAGILSFAGLIVYKIVAQRR
jgi:hypothetical protein